ncbi:hypothetical protein TREMEDRAFT_60068 [Tremella mesenterica DSM 1558]|uniref:uncharacterized protein n=1 Tax=Tremella mesenterica (strain ATCC 24925 / CBS 8224 / DSM 1558 / NBRC 9311 / NRRL Y-6157 / RJB 2259-6 / UBC 559-6) TaxID=578456 RepID=UPI0003F49B7F|nr:uncharacterized protein TREMEDRAFT_60068 [Tremella mesenterica DSM 1558]EIW71133.1 hypothetical protein TREMEDRAFT_60068 [Tremella mesenterica DSM 1558]
MVNKRKNSASSSDSSPETVDWSQIMRKAEQQVYAQRKTLAQSLIKSAQEEVESLTKQHSELLQAHCAEQKSIYTSFINPVTLRRERQQELSLKALTQDRNSRRMIIEYIELFKRCDMSGVGSDAQGMMVEFEKGLKEQAGMIQLQSNVQTKPISSRKKSNSSSI